MRLLIDGGSVARSRKKSSKSMTIVMAMACAVKIANGRTCTAQEQRAALATLGWAYNKGYITGRTLGKRVRVKR